jgi:hypothetical protein
VVVTLSLYRYNQRKRPTIKHEKGFPLIPPTPSQNTSLTISIFFPQDQTLHGNSLFLGPKLLRPGVTRTSESRQGELQELCRVGTE